MNGPSRTLSASGFYETGDYTTEWEGGWKFLEPNVGITRECGAFQPTLLYAPVALVGFMQCWAQMVFSILDYAIY
jgi:hypothetical protein